MDKKVVLHSLFHSYSLFFLSNWKNGKYLSIHFDINLPSIATRLFKCCTFFKFLSDLMSNGAFIFSRLAYFPLIDTSYPKKFPYVTPKTHFLV